MTEDNEEEEDDDDGGDTQGRTMTAGGMEVCLTSNDDLFFITFFNFFIFFCIFFIYRRLNGQAPVTSNSIRRKDRLIRSSRMISVTRKVSCFFFVFLICF